MKVDITAKPRPGDERHWSDFLALTPGTTALQVANRTADSYQFRGSDFASHVIQIDGADVASAQQSATHYLSLATEAVETVQVRTVNLDASAPLGVGALMNVATKSGTNELRGAVSLTVQPRAWSDDNSPGGTASVTDSVLPEVALGGPLLPDRLWFFGAYRHERIRVGVSRSADQVAFLEALDPGFVPFDSRIGGHFVLGKFSAALGAGHRAEMSYQYDPQTSEAAAPQDAGPFVHRPRGTLELHDRSELGVDAAPYHAPGLQLQRPRRLQRAQPRQRPVLPAGSQPTVQSGLRSTTLRQNPRSLILWARVAF